MGLPREAMPPPKGRMAQKGEKEHDASAGTRTRRWRVPYCEQSCSATGRAWSSCGTSGTRSTTSGTFCSIGGSRLCGGCVRAGHRSNKSQTSSEKTRGSAARSSRGRTAVRIWPRCILNREVLGKPRNGWKWILERTPKPTAPYPKVVEVPEKISDYHDITDFLAQFPPVPKEHPALEFFGIDAEWVERHKSELFGFLLAFLVGDAGKYYPEYENRARHYNKAAMTTNMARTDSNFRVLRYVQLALDKIGIQSHQIEAHQLPDGYEVIRWNSETSNLITWIIRTCLGLKVGNRTSRVPIDIPWIHTCPRDFIVAFLQGLADSDGHVHKKRNYAEISSVPNSRFYRRLIEKLDLSVKSYPLNNPKLVRTDLITAYNIPLFNPIIRSYRYETLLQKLRNRGILPPPSSSFFILR